MSLLGKFKATSADKIREDNKELAKKGSFANTRPGYIDLQEGKNLLRWYPAHPDIEGASYIYAKGVHSLPFYIDDKKKDTKTKPIFNAKIHSSLKKDVVEEYIKFVEKVLSDSLEGQDLTPKEKKEKLENALRPITGYMAKKYVGGIKLQLTYVGYADWYGDNPANTPKFGRVEVKYGIKKGMDKITLESDPAEGAIAMEPYTDPYTGLLTNVTHTPNAPNASDKWTVSLYLKNFVPVSVPLTEEQAEDFIKLEPLHKQFTNCYKKGDFDKAVEGLETFDKVNDIGAFHHPNFQEIIKDLEKEVINLVGDGDKKEGGENNKLEAINPLLDFDRDEIVEFIEATELDIKVRPNYDKERLISDIEEEVASIIGCDPDEENASLIYTHIIGMIKEWKGEAKEEDDENESAEIQDKEEDAPPPKTEEFYEKLPFDEEKEDKPTSVKKGLLGKLAK